MLNANTTHLKILKITVYYTDRNTFMNFEFLIFVHMQTAEPRRVQRVIP